MKIRQRFQEHVKILKELLLLIIQNKKWWLLPIYFVFLLACLFAVLSGGNSVLPAIYALF